MRSSTLDRKDERLVVGGMIDAASVRDWAFPVRPVSGRKAVGPFVGTVVVIIATERRDLVGS